MPAPESSSEDALTKVAQAYQKLVVDKAFENPLSKATDANSLSIVSHPFTDKLIVKSGHSVSFLTRDPTTQEFDIEALNHGSHVRSLSSLVNLRLDEKLLEVIFSLINWSAIFKDENAYINAFIAHFYESLAATAQKCGKVISFKAQFNYSKFFVDGCIQYIRLHIDRVQRHYQSLQSVIPVAN